MTPKKYFPDLAPESWTHPADRAAIEAFDSIPAAGNLIDRFIGLAGEKSYRLAAIAEAARATETQFTTIYRLAREACDVLDAPKHPEVFVKFDTQPEARTLGAENPFIVVTSAALDYFEEDELGWIIAREIAHCLSGRATLKTLIHFLSSLPGAFMAESIPYTLPGGAFAALRAWDRASEFSADRAALLVTQDSTVVYRALMRITAGPRIGEMDRTELLRQAREYGRVGVQPEHFHDLLNGNIAVSPFPVIRIAELEAWDHCGDYQDILNGRYARRSASQEGKPADSGIMDEVAARLAESLSEGRKKLDDLVHGLFGLEG